MKTPSLPSLYFSNSDTSSKEQIMQQHDADARRPSLSTLPPELIHTCLVQYADWGDLAKLACVQSQWKDIVHDAATFGGRDAMWELIMCLLHGDGGDDATHNGGEKEAKERSSDDDTIIVVNNAKKNRGLQKNEALAIRYLTRLAGMETVGSILLQENNELVLVDDNGEPAAATTNPTTSALPSDEQPQTTNYCHDNADEAALLQLATCHLSGIGVSQPNPTMAIHCLTTAYHSCQSVESAHKLALIYEYPTQSNNLIPIDVVAAFEWFRAAALKGHVTSMAELALCYELGCGVIQSDEEALDWYTKAANAGHSASHYSVGEHFEEARGVRMDHEEACLWYYRAAVLGEEDGVCGLRRLVDVARRVVPQVDEVLHA